MKIDFDEIKHHPLIYKDAVIICWIKNKIIVKQKEFDGIELMQACKACLFFEGEIVQMTDRHTDEINGQHYTNWRCPKCGTVENRSYCSCREIPHRIACGVGFDKYFPLPPGGKNKTLE